MCVWHVLSTGNMYKTCLKMREDLIDLQVFQCIWNWYARGKWPEGDEDANMDQFT